MTIGYSAPENVGSVFFSLFLKKAAHFAVEQRHILSHFQQSTTMNLPNSRGLKSKSRKMSFELTLIGKKGLPPLRIYISYGKARIPNKQSLLQQRRYWVDQRKETKEWLFLTRLLFPDTSTIQTSRKQNLRLMRLRSLRRKLKRRIERNSRSASTPRKIRIKSLKTTPEQHLQLLQQLPSM